MDYYKFEISSRVADSEALLGLLSHMAFDTFEEQGHILMAYLPIDNYNEEFEDDLAYYKNAYSLTITRTLIPHQNWNEVWEANFSPILIDDFCEIRADFHPLAKNMKHTITINPKMAFGTGHHETTYMMIQMMGKMQLEGKKTLDYGCGTGILAILAHKMGAKPIYAIDIEVASCENATENFESNTTPNIQLHLGTLDVITESTFDVVLANINRNVILDSFKKLNGIIAPEGYLLTSGYYDDDMDLVIAKAQSNGFSFIHKTERNKWVCVLFRHN